jgi:hypothetical protein
MLIVLSACAPRADAPSIEGEAAMSPEQAAAVEDGEITPDEYEAGFQRFRACIEAGGYEVITTGEFNDTIEYAVLAEARELNEACSELEFRQIDRMWQLAREDTSWSAQVLKDCLTRNGISPEDTMEELVEQLENAGIPIDSCGT